MHFVKVLFFVVVRATNVSVRKFQVHYWHFRLILFLNQFNSHVSNIRLCETWKFDYLSYEAMRTTKTTLPETNAKEKQFGWGGGSADCPGSIATKKVLHWRLSMLLSYVKCLVTVSSAKVITTNPRAMQIARD